MKRQKCAKIEKLFPSFFATQRKSCQHEFENESEKSFRSRLEDLDEMLDYNGRIPSESGEKMIKSTEKVLGLIFETMIQKNVVEINVLEEIINNYNAERETKIKRETEIYEKIKKIEETVTTDFKEKYIKELMPELEIYFYGSM